MNTNISNITNIKNTTSINKSNPKPKRKNMKLLMTKENIHICTCDTHYGIYYRTATPTKVDITNFKTLSDQNIGMIDSVSRPTAKMTFSIPTSFS